MNLERYAGKCVHTCRTGKHVISVHTLDDSQECDLIEDKLWHGEYECAECSWNDTGTDHIRGYIK